MRTRLPSPRDDEILARRGPKRPVDPWRPYAFLVEPEPAPRGPAGLVEDVATLFLSNRECPFRCLMCDLWQQTTDTTVPAGAIPAQIDWAFTAMPELCDAAHIKLYNAGNFFDRRAIPPGDHAAIAEQVRGFASVIVENHPRLCDDRCLRFRDRLEGELEIALGLETVHPDVLPRLNKRMTLDDFDRATTFLHRNGIRTRAFVLLRPPFLDRSAGVEWALRSVAHAFALGVSCCAIVPTRAGNGIMEELERAGWFGPPTITDMEAALEQGLAAGGGRLLVDLWDADRFYTCERCGPQRRERLHAANLGQRMPAAVSCPACDGTRDGS